MSRTIRSSLANTVTPRVFPPSTCPRPRRPLDAMPFGNDPTKNEEVKIQQRIPDRPVQTKPPPPEAPCILQGVRSVQESERGVENSPNQYGGAADGDANSASGSNQISDEGNHTLNFGWNIHASYNEAWSWISSSSANMNDLLRGCDFNEDSVQMFIGWIHRESTRSEGGRSMSE